MLVVLQHGHRDVENDHDHHQKDCRDDNCRPTFLKLISYLVRDSQVVRCQVFVTVEFFCDSRSESRRVVERKHHQALLGPTMFPCVTPLRPFLYHLVLCLVSRAKFSFLTSGAYSAGHHPTPCFLRTQGTSQTRRRQRAACLGLRKQNTDDDVCSCFFVAVRCRSDMYLSTYKLCFAASKTHRRILSFPRR